MKKNVLIKGILILVVIAVLSIGFSGCSLEYSPTGTVYLTVYGSYQYDLYMDGYQYFNDVYQGRYTITNVSTGSHLFEAIDSYWGSVWGYDSVYPYITSGPNYVYLYPPYTP